MDHSNALWTGLGNLTDTLDKAPTNLEVELRRLGDDLGRAVASYLGLSIKITLESGPVSFTTWRGTGGPPVGSSLLIPLPLICPSAPGSALILYAAAPGAFVDLGADLSFALGKPLAAFVLDAHLPKHVHRRANPQISGLRDFSNVNRAIGVLLACGRTRVQAKTELWDRAADDASRVLYTAAEAIIKTTEGGAGSPHVLT